MPFKSGLRSGGTRPAVRRRGLETRRGRAALRLDSLPRRSSVASRERRRDGRGRRHCQQDESTHQSHATHPPSRSALRRAGPTSPTYSTHATY